MRTARVRVTQMTGLKVRDQPSITSSQPLSQTLSMYIPLLLDVVPVHGLYFPSWTMLTPLLQSSQSFQHRSVNVESKDKMSCEDLTRIWQLCHIMKNRTFDRFALSATSQMLMFSRLTTGCKLRGMRLDKYTLLFIHCFKCLLLPAVGGKIPGLIQCSGSYTLL